MRLPKDEYSYLCHAHRLVHALRWGLLVGGHRGFYMGVLVHREDAKVRKTKLGHHRKASGGRTGQPARLLGMSRVGCTKNEAT